MLTATDVIATVWEHAESSLDKEVGGILLGVRTQAGAEVRRALPAVEAEGHRANVTFTHEVWERIHRTVDTEYPDLEIVGWYHSHPGFGIFLSEYDRFIQQNFFSAAHQLALVVDPHAGTLGWFGWQDGEIALLEKAGPFPEHSHLPNGSRSAPTPSLPQARPPRRSAPLLLSATGAAIVLGIGGYLLGSAQQAPGDDAPVPDASQSPPSPPQETVDASEDLIRQLEQALAEAEAERSALAQELAESRAAVDMAEQPAAAASEPVEQPTEILWTVTVQPGDSLSRFAQLLYDDAAAVDRIIAANPGLADPDVLQIGQTINVPIALEP